MDIATVEPARHAIEWWEGAGGALLGGVIGALIGSLIPLAWQKYTRYVERRGELNALAAELYHAKLAMNALTGTQPVVLAPLYQLPLTTFERALPKLIGEGVLTDDEVACLIEYVMRAEELNRGLDLATQVASTGEGRAAVGEQYNRNKAKVEHILQDKQDRYRGVTVFDAAEAAIYRVMCAHVRGGDGNATRQPLRRDAARPRK